MNDTEKNLNQRGAALLYSILLISFLLTISAAVFISQFQQLRFATREGLSLVAITAADSGLERALFEISQSGLPDTCTTAGCYVQGTLLDGTAAYDVFVPVGKNAGTGNLVIRSIGSFQGVKRSLEIQLNI